jgi:hypothetical protein
VKTKILLAGVALGLCVLPIAADEKDNVKTPPPPSLTFEFPIYGTYEPSGDSSFVIPLPKDKSDFTVKPPPDAVIENPALRQKSRDQRSSSPRFALPKMPQMKTTVPPPQSLVGVLRASPKWGLKDAALSNVLQTIAQVCNAKIVACFTPEKLTEDPKITMRLDGKTADEKLNELKVLGLVWRKIGETYFVAWSENDLPPLQSVAPTNE